jgi:hypothetical protein
MANGQRQIAFRWRLVTATGTGSDLNGLRGHFLAVTSRHGNSASSHAGGGAGGRRAGLSVGIIAGRAHEEINEASGYG